MIFMWVTVLILIVALFEIARQGVWEVVRLVRRSKRVFGYANRDYPWMGLVIGTMTVSLGIWWWTLQVRLQHPPYRGVRQEGMD